VGSEGQGSAGGQLLRPGSALVLPVSEQRACPVDV
jgi:hypothetical protein